VANVPALASPGMVAGRFADARDDRTYPPSEMAPDRGILWVALPTLERLSSRSSRARLSPDEASGPISSALGAAMNCARPPHCEVDTQDDLF